MPLCSLHPLWETPDHMLLPAPGSYRFDVILAHVLAMRLRTGLCRGAGIAHVPFLVGRGEAAPPPALRAISFQGQSRCHMGKRKTDHHMRSV